MSASCYSGDAEPQPCRCAPLFKAQVLHLQAAVRPGDNVLDRPIRSDIHVTSTSNITPILPKVAAKGQMHPFSALVRVWLALSPRYRQIGYHVVYVDGFHSLLKHVGARCEILQPRAAFPQW